MTRTGRAGGRLLLLGLLGLSALPVLLATLAYLVWPPDGGRSYGELVAQPLPFHPLPGRWLLVEEDALEACVDPDRIELAGIANRRRWWLVPPGAVVGECRASDSERERAAAGQARDQAGAS